MQAQHARHGAHRTAERGRDHGELGHAGHIVEGRTEWLQIARQKSHEPRAGGCTECKVGCLFLRQNLVVERKRSQQNARHPRPAETQARHGANACRQPDGYDGISNVGKEFEAEPIRQRIGQRGQPDNQRKAPDFSGTGQGQSGQEVGPVYCPGSSSARTDSSASLRVSSERPLSCSASISAASMVSVSSGRVSVSRLATNTAAAPVTCNSWRRSFISISISSRSRRISSSFMACRGMLVSSYSQPNRVKTPVYPYKRLWEISPLAKNPTSGKSPKVSRISPSSRLGAPNIGLPRPRQE